MCRPIGFGRKEKIMDNMTFRTFLRRQVTAGRCAARGVAVAGLLGLVASAGVARAAGTPFLYAANYTAGCIDTLDAAGNKIASTPNNGQYRWNSLVADKSGNVYVSIANQIYKINMTTGDGSKTAFVKDPADDNEIFGLALDAANNLYFGSETTGKLYKVTPDGTAHVFASGLGNPGAITIDKVGNLYVGDQGFVGPNGSKAKNGDKVYKVTPAGIVSTYASGFKTAANIQNSDVLGLAFNPADKGARAGTLYVSLDQDAAGNNAGIKIAQVAPGGGSASKITPYVTTNGPAPGYYLGSIAFDQSGNLYYVDNGGGGSIYKVGPGGAGAATKFGTTQNGFGIALAPARANPIGK